MAADLGTKYLGLSLRNPIIVASCPLAAELDVLLRLEERGAAAAVLPSLFEEQIDKPSTSGAAAGGPPGWAESLHYHRELAIYNRGLSPYLKYIEQAKKRVAIPLIASLNGTKPGPWLKTSKQLEQAGADALELNAYFVVTDPNVSSAQVEDRYVEMVHAVSAEVSIPLAVKIGPFFSALPSFAMRLMNAGASGLVLFNRYLQPEVSPTTLRAVPHLALSTSEELRLPLRWTAILRDLTSASLACTTGVHTSTDIVKALLVGADAVMIASALYRHGTDYLADLLNGLSSWLDERHYQRIDQLRGRLSHKNSPDPGAFERANYTKAA